VFYRHPQVLCKLPTHIRVIWGGLIKLLWGNAHIKRRRSQFGLQLRATAFTADRQTDVTGNLLFTSRRQTKWRIATAGLLFAIKNKWITGHLLEKCRIALRTHDTYYVTPLVTKDMSHSDGRLLRNDAFVDWYTRNNVSEDISACIFRVFWRDFKTIPIFSLHHCT